MTNKLPSDLRDLTLSDVEGRADDLAILKFYEAVASSPGTKHDELLSPLQTRIRHDLQEFIRTGHGSDIVRAMVCAVLSACTVQLDEADKKKRATFIYRATGLTARPSSIPLDERLYKLEDLTPWLDLPKCQEEREKIIAEGLSDQEKADGEDGERRIKDAQHRKNRPKSNGKVRT